MGFFSRKISSSKSSANEIYGERKREGVCVREKKDKLREKKHQI